MNSTLGTLLINESLPDKYKIILSTGGTINCIGTPAPGLVHLWDFLNPWVAKTNLAE